MSKKYSIKLGGLRGSITFVGLNKKIFLKSKSIEKNVLPTSLALNICEFGIQFLDIRVRLGFGVQRHFQQYFSYIVAVSFICGGNQSTLRKPPTCCKSLTKFIT